MKKTTKLMCGLLSLGLLATGCATVGNVKNKNEDLIYNGNAAVMVDGYLYYANAFDESSFSTDSDYKNSAKTAYLARLNTNIELASESQDYSPANVEKVAGEVAGQANSFMFVLGNHIYYATPNRKEFENDEGKPEKHFEYTTFYRSQLNGNKKTKIYTTKGKVSQIEVLKCDGKYYIVMLAGDQLVKINIGTAKNAKADVKVVAEGVTSVAMPKTYQQNKAGSSADNWNGYVYYTAPKSEEDDRTAVSKIKLSSNEAESMETYDKALTFIGRENDVVFFTYPETSSHTYTYVADLTDDNGQFAIRNNKVELDQIKASNIMLLTEEVSGISQGCGYIYMDSSTLMYAKKTANGYQTKILDLGNVTSYSILSVSGKTVYLATSTSIYRADLSTAIASSESIATVTCTEIVKMTKIDNDGLYAFDKNYVYFYAELEEVEIEEGEEAEEDANLYLYRARLSRNADTTAEENYQLLSLTSIKSRRTEG